MKAFGLQQENNSSDQGQPIATIGVRQDDAESDFRYLTLSNLGVEKLLAKKKSLEWLIKDGNGARPDVKRLAAYQKELDAVNEILSTKVH